MSSIEDKEQKRIKQLLKRHKEVIGSPCTYSTLTSVLNITNHKHKERRIRQLEKLGEVINFEILENGDINIFGVKRKKEYVKKEKISTKKVVENEFKTIRDFYGTNGGTNLDGDRPNIELRDIVKTSIMGIVKNRLYLSKNYVCIIGFEDLGYDMGFFNPLYGIVRRKSAKAIRTINGVGGRPKRIMVGQMVRALNNINSSYTGYISRGLENLKQEGYINYRITYWGHRLFSDSGVSVPLSLKEEIFYEGEGREIIYKEMKVENYGKIKQLNKEEEFFDRLNILMRERFGLVFIKRKLEISLGEKTTNELLQKVRWGKSEIKWVNKHFYESLKQNSEEYYKHHSRERADEKNYNLLLEVLVKREKYGDREELKDIRKALYEGLNGK